jgi:crotonobetainyl-CoA:carnitine CoA-transferase CaiB-like acyl-CoA transferase
MQFDADGGQSMTTGRGAAIGPLRGVRVLDLTRFPPGGYCTASLADLGADVIRIESPSAKGQPSLVIGQVGMARGKRSITIDLRQPRSYDVLARVADSVDVLVENNLPGELEQRGFGYSHAAARHPALIWCAITGFGQNGPYAQWPGHDITYLGQSGLLAALETDFPWNPGWMVAVPIGAMAATAAITAALFERTSTGTGRHLDISLAEAATWTLGGIDAALADQPMQSWADPGRTMYRCADDTWITVAAAEPRTWSALCAGLGLHHLADWAAAHSLPTDDVAAELAAVFATRPAGVWVDALGPTGAAVGPVNSGGAVMRDAHSAARGTVAEVAGVRVPISPIRMCDANGVATTTTATAAPAAVGEHTESVLFEAGFTAAEVTELRNEGVI